MTGSAADRFREEATLFDKKNARRDMRAVGFVSA
jgi:hypothetical protein